MELEEEWSLRRNGSFEDGEGSLRGGAEMLTVVTPWNAHGRNVHPRMLTAVKDELTVVMNNGSQ
ncbi:uridylyltransferase [Sesbania bispinosa]|nr:uridylyltransferase [Sesbania bispinosa]